MQIVLCAFSGFTGEDGRWKILSSSSRPQSRIEEVQMLNFEAVRRLVAYGWVAAGFLFHQGLTLDQPEIRLLAVLGGWEERKNRPQRTNR